jgi:hypothetical protein
MKHVLLESRTNVLLKVLDTSGKREKNSNLTDSPINFTGHRYVIASSY